MAIDKDNMMEDENRDGGIQTPGVDNGSEGGVASGSASDGVSSSAGNPAVESNGVSPTGNATAGNASTGYAANVGESEGSGAGVGSDAGADSEAGAGAGSGSSSSHIEKLNQTSEVPDDAKDDAYSPLLEYFKEWLEGERYTKKDLEAIRRREKRDRIISGISDAARAVVNLIGTSAYAPNMYDGSKMSDKTKERYDKEIDDYYTRRKEWLDLAMKRASIIKAKSDHNLTLWEKKRQAIKDNMDYEYKEALNAIDLESKRYGLGTKKAQLAEANAKAAEAVAKAQYAPALFESEIGKNNAAANASNASAARSYAEAKKALAQGVKFMGETYYNNDALTKAVFRNAMDQNIELEEFVKNGKIMNVPELAAVVEREITIKRKDEAERKKEGVKRHKRSDKTSGNSTPPPLN